MNIFDKHQLKIARDTLKLSDIGASIVGGMTKAEATEIVLKHAKNYARNVARRERDSVMRDCGLTKVKGALGGAYWE